MNVNEAKELYNKYVSDNSPQGRLAHQMELVYDRIRHAITVNGKRKGSWRDLVHGEVSYIPEALDELVLHELRLAGYVVNNCDPSGIRMAPSRWTIHWE